MTQNSARVATKGRPPSGSPIFRLRPPLAGLAVMAAVQESRRRATSAAASRSQSSSEAVTTTPRVLLAPAADSEGVRTPAGGLLGCGTR